MKEKIILFAAALVVGIVIGGGGAFLLLAFLDDEDDNDSKTGPSPPTPPAPPTPTPPAPSPPTTTSAPTPSTTSPPATAPTDVPAPNDPSTPEPAPPSSPCEGWCEAVTNAVDPVMPPSTRALLNVTGTCQDFALRWVADDYEATRTDEDLENALNNNTIFSNNDDLAERMRQRFALVVLYCATNGEFWTQNGGWLVGQEECQWTVQQGYDWSIEGSTTAPCNGDGLFRHLVLKNNNLTGTIPPELSMLSMLEQVDFSDNNFEPGTIPSDLNKLLELKSLKLAQGNFLRSPLPSFVFQFQNLQELDLSHNDFTGQMPSTIHQTAPQLHHLYLQHNSLEGIIPATFGQLDWRILHLHMNKLTGIIPRDLDSPDFEELCLHNNTLQGQFPAREFAGVQDDGGRRQRTLLTRTVARTGTATSGEGFYQPPNQMLRREQEQGSPLLRKLTLYDNDFTGSVDVLCQFTTSEGGNLEVFAVDLAVVACNCCTGPP